MHIIGWLLIAFAGIDIIGGVLGAISTQQQGKTPNFVNTLPSSVFEKPYKAVPFLNFILIGAGILLIVFGRRR